jgi:hypothetical protein
MAHEFGLDAGYWTTDSGTCKNGRCGTDLKAGATVFFDDAGGAYCERCGVVVRYERKRGAQRKAVGQTTRHVMGLKE